MNWYYNNWLTLRVTEKKLGVEPSDSNDEQKSEDDGIVDPQPDSRGQDGSNHGDDDDDDDFVVQDDGEVIPELPMAFSHQSHQDTVHDFKVVFQLFVHLTMMPMNKRRAYMEEVLNSTDLYTSL